MLEELTGLNTAAADILRNKLSPKILDNIPYLELHSRIEAFGDCSCLHDLPYILQSAFLMAPEDYVAYRYLGCSQDKACALYSDKCFRGLSAYDAGILSMIPNGFTNIKDYARILDNPTACLRLGNVWRNCMVHNAPTDSEFVAENIWQFIEWDSDSLEQLHENPDIAIPAQYLSEHLSDVTIESSEICSIKNPRECTNTMIRLWFHCGKDKAAFSKIVSKYANVGMLGFIPASPEDEPVCVLKGLYPRYSKFIDDIDFSTLYVDVQRLIIFALTNGKSKFLKFVEQNATVVEEMHASALTQEWFRRYLNINSVSTGNYKELISLPTCNILNLKKQMKLDTFLKEMSKL